MILRLTSTAFINFFIEFFLSIFSIAIQLQETAFVEKIYIYLMFGFVFEKYIYIQHFSLKSTSDIKSLFEKILNKKICNIK